MASQPGLPTHRAPPGPTQVFRTEREAHGRGTEGLLGSKKHWEMGVAPINPNDHQFMGFSRKSSVHAGKAWG